MAVLPPQFILRAAWIFAGFLMVALSPAIQAKDSVDTALPPDIEKILALPEGKIDVGIAALTFAKDIYPAIDIGAYSRKIDQIVAQVKAATAGSTDPDHRIRVMNDVIYKQLQFHYDETADAAERGKGQETYYLNLLLDTRQGNCFSMPILYMAVAQRLGYPVYAVSTPDHFFLRYVSPGLKMANIEATSGGGYSPDWKYIEDLKIPDRGVKSGAYMRTLSNREFLAALLMTNGITAQHRDKNLASAVPYFERAEEINPKDANLAKNLAITYGRIGENSAKLGLDRIVRFCATKTQKYEAQATELGFQKGER